MLQKALVECGILCLEHAHRSSIDPTVSPFLFSPLTKQCLWTQHNSLLKKISRDKSVQRSPSSSRPSKNQKWLLVRCCSFSKISISCIWLLFCLNKYSRHSLLTNFSISLLMWSMRLSQQYLHLVKEIRLMASFLSCVQGAWLAMCKSPTPTESGFGLRLLSCIACSFLIFNNALAGLVHFILNQSVQTREAHNI